MEEIYSRQLYSGKEISRGIGTQIIRNWPGVDRRLWTAWWKNQAAGFPKPAACGPRRSKQGRLSGRSTAPGNQEEYFL